MQIILNGQNYELPEIESGSENGSQSPQSAVFSLSMLVAHRELNPRQIAIELNGNLIPRENFDVTQLAAGDSIEVVTLAGGG